MNRTSLTLIAKVLRTVAVETEAATADVAEIAAGAVDVRAAEVVVDVVDAAAVEVVTAAVAMAGTVVAADVTKFFSADEYGFRGWDLRTALCGSIARTFCI